MWVPSHSGIAGKVMVDTVTVQSSTKIPILTINNISTCGIVNSLSKVIILTWQNYLNIKSLSNNLKNIKKQLKK